MPSVGGGHLARAAHVHARSYKMLQLQAIAMLRKTHPRGVSLLHWREQMGRLPKRKAAMLRVLQSPGKLSQRPAAGTIRAEAHFGTLGGRCCSGIGSVIVLHVLHIMCRSRASHSFQQEDSCTSQHKPTARSARPIRTKAHLGTCDYVGVSTLLATGRFTGGGPIS